MEGGMNQDGKGPNTYDVWFATGTGAGLDNGNVAIDHYNRWYDDLGYLKTLGATAYRFSIAWSRIFPNCNDATPNAAGIAFYSKYIDRIRAMGAEPYLTMFHWDLPQACFTQYQGFAGTQIIADFIKYAKVLFDNYGDRVTYWLTLNEADANCKFSYQNPTNKEDAMTCGYPNTTSDYCLAPAAGLGVASGKWACMKNSHLIHGSIVQMARSQYPNKPWKFGLPSIQSWYQPLPENDPAQIAAAQNLFELDVGEMWDPVVFGDWGAALKAKEGDGQIVSNTYAFNETEQAIIKGTMDFIALNYYSVSGVGSGDIAGAIGRTDGYWQTIYAPGLQKVIKQTNTYYTSKGAKMDIHITECGLDVQGEYKLSLAEAVTNQERIDFWTNHTTYLAKSILEDKMPVKAFLAWSLFDNFEWSTYQHRFGQIAVAESYNNNLTRTIKFGGYYLRDWFSNQTFPFAPINPPSATTSGVATGGSWSTNAAGSSGTVTGVPSTGGPTSSKSGAPGRSSWSLEVAVMLFTAVLGMMA
ncbi:hypothetical protein HK101_001395 [Irineochytrium annulatum]|nr:hypothetical protein HK101_001395 [Irineochytrium annulatum]